MPWTIVQQAPLPKEFSRQEYCSGLPFSSLGDLPNPETEPGSPTLQADSLQSEPPGKPLYNRVSLKLAVAAKKPSFNIYDVCVHAKSLRWCPSLCNPMTCSPPGFSVHGDSPGKKTGVSCCPLLQGIFPT